MALQDFVIRYPDVFTGTVTANTSLTIDADGERVGYILRMPAAGDIEGFGFYVPSTTTADDLTCSAQTVAAGVPDDTEDQTGTVAIATSDDNVFKSVTFGSNRTVTIDEVVAFVIRHTTWVDGNMTIGVVSISLAASNYTLLRTGGSWAKQAGRGANVAVRYSGGVYHPIPGALSGARVTFIDFASNSAADEVALYITLSQEISVLGMGFIGRLNAATDMVLYNSANSVLETVSMVATDTAGATEAPPRDFLFAPRTLAAGTYRVSLKPTTTTSNRLYYCDVADAAMLDQMSGRKEAHYSSRVDGATTGGTLNDGWTQVATRRPLIYLLVNQVHDGAGGAGSGMLFSRRRRDNQSTILRM